jgi:predicted P-loop ATPase
LIPPELKNYYTSEFYVSNEKDNLLKLSQNFLIIWEELNNMSEKGVEWVKKMLSMSKINGIRKAYGRNFEDYERLSSFCGSTNSIKFLEDETGSRRFFIVELNKRIRMKQIQSEISINQLWSQIKYLYSQGHPHYFTQGQEKKFQKRNKKYQKLVPIEELAETNLSQGNDLGTTTDIAIQLFRKAEVKRIPNQSELRLLGVWLKKEGFMKKAFKNSSGTMNFGWLYNIN